jgi:hypothetical protein
MTAKSSVFKGPGIRVNYLSNDRELKLWQRFYQPGDLGHIERESLKG